MGNTLRKKELMKLYNDIINEMKDIFDNDLADTSEGVARQRAIIGKIDAHPEVLRVQTEDWAYYTIGICAALDRLFYVTMRALEDVEACMLKDDSNENIYGAIKCEEKLQKRIVNSWQYKRLIAKQEESLISGEEPQYDDDDLFGEDECFDDKDEDMSEYDSIME